jgi:Periplasmic copper-binding protein (NosD)/Protein of unknown function (DUF1565)
LDLSQRLSAAKAIALAVYWNIHVTGSDSNPGTLSQPFKTINGAANVAKPGTDVVVRGGTYNGSVYIPLSGVPGGYIRFYPYPGESIIMDGTGIPAGRDLVGIGGNYVELRGFELRNNMNGTGIDAWCVHHTTITNNVVHDMNNNGIFVGCDSQPKSHDNIIQGNIVYNTVMSNSSRSKNAGWNQAISLEASSNSIVSQNLVYDNYGEGIGSGFSPGVVISGNTLYDNYSVQIYLSGTSYNYNTVNGNFIYNTGNTNFTYKIPAGRPLPSEPQ